MKNIKPLPYLVAIVLFLLIAIIYCHPVLEGKKVQMGDITKYKGQSKELTDYKEKTGKDAQWTNSMFGGMPSYLIQTPSPPKFNYLLNKLVNINHIRPLSYLFLYMLGFYIALLCFGVNPWLSIVGAIAYGFSSYFFILIPAGHSSKAMALGYMPAIIGGVRLAFHDKRLLGSVIFAIFFTLQLQINHLQITYYTFIIILVYGIAELYYSLKDKGLNKFLLVSAYLIFFGLIAIGCNLKVLWTTYEYGKYTIRGKSELTTESENKTSGLDKDYATDWSYGIAESFTLLIPNFYGGSSMAELNTDSETFELLSSAQGKAQAKKTIKQMPMYWGEQPFTSGPVYVGAIICLFFILGLFVLDNKIKWWVLIATIISLILAWGKHVPGITHFLLDHLPGYNKFRAVSTTLVIAQFTMPLLAILTLERVFSGKIKLAKLKKGLLYSFGISGGLALFFYLFGKGMFDFEAVSDQQYLAQGATQIVDAWQADRAMLLKKDAFRSFVFISLASGLIFLFISKKLKLQYAIAGLGLLVLFDMWPVDKRYFNNDHFVSKKEIKTPYVKYPADNYILQDEDPHYRVLNLAVSTFNDASTSYFHKSIGGYHGAKWRRYQELYEHKMFPESQAIIQSLQSQDLAQVNAALENANVLNMLNTKYIIFNPKAQPLRNSTANGNAWFVSNYEIVNNADEEIARLGQIDTKTQAVIDERFSDFVDEKNLSSDSLSIIQLDEYRPNYLKYTSLSESEQLALFSEIYYPKGWKAKIDGQEVDHFRANYLLRALLIPEGDHIIEFSFEPRSYNIGGKIAAASSWVLFLSILITVLYPVWINRKSVGVEK